MAKSKRHKPGDPDTPPIQVDEPASKPSIPIAIRDSMPETVEEAEARVRATGRAIAEVQIEREGMSDEGAVEFEEEGEPGSLDEPGSPEPAQDYLEPDYDRPDDDKQVEDKGQRTFTPEDEARYRSLDARIDKGERECFEAVREIRQKDYWLLERDDDGKPLYKSFQEWVEEHKGRDKTWATKGTNWLAVMEAQDRLGISFPIGLKAAQALSPLKGREKCQAVGGLAAVLKEAYEDERLDKDGRISYEGLKTVVDMRLAFFKPLNANLKPATTSYQQYRRDYRTTQELAKSLPVKTSYSVMTETLHRGLPSDHLLAVCKEKRQLPRAEDLVAQYTGDDLDAVLVDLGVLAKELNDDEALLDSLAKKKQLLKAQQQPLAPLKEEVRNLQAQAKKKGLIKKKGGKGDPKPGVHKEDDEEEDGEDAEDEIQDHLDDAINSLKEALDYEDWPEPEEINRLNRIKEKATCCREASNKVLSKVEELTVAADVKPEQIPTK